MTAACPHCARKFARSEHLTRHIESVHDRVRTFTCNVCGKEFNRSDSCRRHQQAHDGSSNIIKGTRGVRMKRACRPCAAARAKCSGGECCERCHDKQLECVYGTGKRKPQAPRRSRRSPATSPAAGGPQDTQPDVEISQDLLPTPASETPLLDSTIPLPDHPQQDQTTLTQLPAELPQYAFDQGLQPALEHISWSDNINWLPLNDNDFDMSILEGFELTAHLPDAAWSQSGPLEGRSPLTSVSSSAGRSINTARRRRHSESRYIDGHGARQSLQKAIKPSRAPVEASWLRNDVYAFPYSMSHTVEEGAGEHGFVTQYAYSMILGQFQMLCARGGGFWKPFDSPAFPSRAHLERCLLLYLELCAPHVPMLHSTFWRQPVIPWPVLLGCMAIGSSFDQEIGAAEATHAFREFLRRSVRWCLEADTALDRSTLAQTCLLNVITQFNSYSDDNALSATADLKLALELYQQSYRRQPLEQIDCSQIELLWTTWVQEETHKRLLWFSWLVDLMLSMSRCHYSLPKLTTRIEHLPCASARWEADTAWDWNALPVAAQQQTGLVESLHWLYVKHKIPTVLDATQNTLLTYAVVARTEEVAATVKLALHNWSPTPADGDDEDECESLEAAPKDQWLPANHEYAAWRNSACDVFDSLHFKANSDAAAARGFEGPAILHLHLARLVLLCPYRDFMALVSNLCRQVSVTANSVSASHLTANILKWLTLDDHKGRLSLVHAGAIFWYIRRYSLAFFYEPFAIYVSTIVLWTYSLYLPQIRNVLLGIKDSRERKHREQQQERSDIAQSRPESSNESEDDDLIPNTILLDRPCDDEIVQAFVRKGHSMTAEMSGAGDICTPQGRRRLLEEGMKLLRRSQYAGYGKAREYCHLIQKLAQRT